MVLRLEGFFFFFFKKKVSFPLTAEHLYRYGLDRASIILAPIAPCKAIVLQLTISCHFKIKVCLPAVRGVHKTTLTNEKKQAEERVNHLPTAMRKVSKEVKSKSIASEF